MFGHKIAAFKGVGVWDYIWRLHVVGFFAGAVRGCSWLAGSDRHGWDVVGVRKRAALIPEILKGKVGISG